jgi:hypothetical protein
MDQEKEANPIEEIFDEVFTLLQDLETRSVAVLEYLQEQGGVTDEKLAPYLDRAAAASDVRLRAARARMEYLLAPKPKSSTDVGKDEKADGSSQAKGKEAAKPQGKKEQVAESKDLGKELASTQPGEQESSDSKDGKLQSTKPTINAKNDQKKDGDRYKEPTDAESQAAALSGEKHSDAQKTDNDKNRSSQSDAGKSASQTFDEEKQQTQKAAK